MRSGKAPTPTGPTRLTPGFTLIELMVVMAVIATLLSLVAPRYIDSIDKAKEATLKTNLRLTREAIDKYKGDTGHYPKKLTELVQGRYLRQAPIDPITDSGNTWTLVHPRGSASQEEIFDIKSGAEGTDHRGSPYSTW